MLTLDQADAASALLVAHWQAGTRLPALPDELRPITRADGYAIQSRLLARPAMSAFGWKIAATSEAGQRHINVDGPLAGRIVRERVLADGARVVLCNTQMRVAEVEFAFRMGADLAPRAAPYDVDSVMAAVETLHPSIEIPDSRYEVFGAVGAAQLIADAACAHLLVVGEALPGRWRDLDLVTYAPVGRRLGPRPDQRIGSGANVLGDPRRALTWLVNELSGLGITLAAGETVTTGTCLAPIPIEPGDTIVADYPGLGQLQVHID